MDPAFSAVYEGNTDQTFLDLTQKAAALPETGHAWKNIGPFGGTVDIPGIGSGNELLGPVDGIGTAIAVDPSDKTGNTAYLGTIGGLYKTTDGGRTSTNIVEGKLPRQSIGAIALDPNDPKTIYAGTGVSIFTLSDDAAGTGVYVSHDRGAHWSRPAANTHGYGVNSIVITTDPSAKTATNKNGTVVLVGTTYGLWRSTDNGGSFRQISLPDNNPPSDYHPLGNWVTSIVVNPTKVHEVTVAVGYAFGKKQYPNGEVIARGNGLYRSTDSGGSFLPLASTAQLTWQGASSDPVGRTSLAYSSAPGGTGIMWALVSDAGKTAGDHGCVDTPAIPVCPDGNTELNGLYRSSDDGTTWQLQATPQILATTLGGTLSAAGYPESYAAGVQSSYNNWVLTDPLDPNRVYFGLEEAFTGEYNDPTGVLPLPSTTFTAVEKYANVCGFLTYPNRIPNDNGEACPAAIPEYGGGTTHPDQHSAAFAATPGGGFRLYSGNDGGWWAQDAHPVDDTTGVQYLGFDSATWRSLGKPATVLPWDVTRLEDGSYLLGLQDNGVAHVRPDGTSYQVCGGDGVYVFPGFNAKSYYCGIDGQRILATTDDFAHTVDITPFNNYTGNTFLSPWTVDSTDPNHLLAAAGNVDETTQGPNSVTPVDPAGAFVNSTWQTVFTPPAAPDNRTWDSSAVFSQGNVGYVAMCAPCRPSLATGSAGNAGIVTTRIATNVQPGCTSVELATTAATGDCWYMPDPPKMTDGKAFPHQQISGIAVDPNNPQVLYVSLRQFIVMGASTADTGTQKVMVSRDGGKHFTDLTGNLPDADAHRIVLRDGQLYVATDVGVFTAPAGSTSWKRFGIGLPQVTYRSMQLDPTGQYLVAGAYGRGGWVYDFGPTSPGHESDGAGVGAHPKVQARAATPKSTIVARADKPSTADRAQEPRPGERAAEMNSELASSHRNPWVPAAEVTFGVLAALALLLASGLGGRWQRRRSARQL